MDDLLEALDAAHGALRMVDASDGTRPQTAATFEAVSAAVLIVEEAAQAAGFRLSEFRSNWPSGRSAWPNGALIVLSASRGASDEPVPAVTTARTDLRR